MRKSYLFAYNDVIGSREEIKTYLNSLPQILNWRYELPNSFYLVSELSADESADLILKFTNKKGFFIVTELNPNKQGWLPKKSWAVINKKLDPG